MRTLVLLLALVFFCPAADTAETLTVPVVFHVLTFRSFGRVTDEQIVRQVAKLNEVYSRTPVRFRLIGVTRTESLEWFWKTRRGMFADDEAVRALREGGKETLNVYTLCLPLGELGWATSPEDYELDPEGDGVIVDFRTLPGSGRGDYADGVTLPHETGHWLGLLHTMTKDVPFDRCGSFNLMSPNDPDRCAKRLTTWQIERLTRWARWREG